MKIKIYLLALVMCFGFSMSGQKQSSDTTKNIKLDEIIVKANRLPIALKNNPGSVSIVTPAMLSNMPKAVAVEEALRLIPGVRIDNQHNGERIHMSIRGQGILTERGLRGIGVMLDGIPINDPSGFAPDLYDVDWSTINKIEILRGPAASLYGGSSAAGVLNITTNNGGTTPFGGIVSQTFGSNGFRKSLVQMNGYNKELDYRISYSRTDGDGYRDHQAFWGNKLYEKINFRPNNKVSFTQIFSHIDYFHQNPEGLNLGQFDNLLQANPDACPFNEYQKTNRTTLGIVGNINFNKFNDIQISSYYRTWNYKETSNKCAEYRTITTPGMSIQYNLHLASGNFKNHFSIGSDFKWQNINMYKLQSAGNPDRVESTDETNIETDSLLANQIIAQNSVGAFALYKMEVGNFNLMASLRYDEMNNELTDKMMALDSAKTSKDFAKTTARIGVNYSFSNAISLFANWSQGFIPPSTEELASNPVGYHGFNIFLKPATSTCTEFGFRGFIDDFFNYEITGFVMNTEDDFFRFKQSGRGNQEVFYGNAGNSERKGIETSFSINLMRNLKLQLAYTYADYKYTSATINSVYTDTAYVLTTPPESGQWLPNSPKHQLYSELSYTFFDKLTFNISTEYQSKWAIYTDAKAYSGEMDPAIYQNWQDGFNLFHASVSYQWKLWRLNGECSLFVRNLTDKEFMAFTEPDPDGNSYQPGPGREIFGTIKIKF